MGCGSHAQGSPAAAGHPLGCVMKPLRGWERHLDACGQQGPVLLCVANETRRESGRDARQGGGTEYVQH